MPEPGSQTPRDFETSAPTTPAVAEPPTATAQSTQAVPKDPPPAGSMSTKPVSSPPVSPAPAPVVLAPLAPVALVQRQPTFGPQWSGPGGRAAPAVLVAAGAAGLAAAAALPWDRPGVGWLATALVAAAATVGAAWARGAGTGVSANVGTDAVRADVTGRAGAGTRIARVLWAIAALALVGVGAVRAASWLFVLCLLAACVSGSLSLAGGRSVRALFLGTVAVPIATIRALPWTVRGLLAIRSRTGGSAARTAAAVAVGVALLVIFGALFAGADAAFAKVLQDILPTVDAGVVSRWLFSFAVLGLGTIGACFLALAPPSFDGEPSQRRPLRRIEWALPVGGLVVLFAAFVGVQATILFGGGDHVLRTAGLTYAEYARSGFWQLLAVTVLTLVVLGIAARKAARQTLADRIWLRSLLGGLAALALVVVASALSRMWAYEQAYGFTQLRLLVSVCEVWLGVVFVFVIVAGVRLHIHAMWLPRAVVGTAVVALLGIAALNPDRFIAEQNLIRYEKTGNIDLDYLSQLSADAVPVLDRLPEPQRTCVLVDIDADLDRTGPDDWHGWNLGRTQARATLADYRAPDTRVSASCRVLRLSTRS